MSQENMEVVRRAIETFPTDVEAWLDTMDPAIRWYPLEEGHSLVLGREAARRCRERWMETFDKESHRGELTELRGEGENVFAAVYEWGRGRGSGIEIEGGVYIHYKVRNGKIAYCYEYANRDEALEAAGLSE
jgi:ketosteroid isomerase-like protein